MLKIGNTVGIDKFAFDLSSSNIPDLELEYGKYWIAETGEIMFRKGKIGRMQIQQNLDYTRFEFNPAIYLYNNNFFTVNFSEFQRMLNEIEMELGFSIKKGIVRKLHPQATIAVDYEPKNYFNILGNSQNYHRSKEKTTLYYKTQARKNYKTNLFYDKKLQSSFKIPKEFIGGEYLRFENQYYNDFLNYIAKRAGKKNFLVGDLLNPEVYKIIIDTWYNEYKKINKEKEYIFNLENIKKPSDIDTLLVNQGLISLGGFIEFEKIFEATKPL